MNILNNLAKPKVNRTSLEKKQFKTQGKELIQFLTRDLTLLTERNTKTNHINHKIHYLLHNPYTFVQAYVAISKNKGVLTKGVETDQEVNRFFGLINADRIAEQFKNDTYKFNPVRRTWIPKPGKLTKRPLDTPTQEDRIVQEAIRGILEAIYEPEFREFAKITENRVNNYGFRPTLTTWKAANAIKIYGQATTYVIEGDISKAYNTINHNKLLTILSYRIKDKKFLKLISDLLKSGVMDGPHFEHSLEGTPQGGIVSPLLFNIYMFEFDKYVYNEIVKPFIKHKPKQRKSKEWQNLGYAMRIALKRWRDNIKDPSAVQLHKKTYRELRSRRLTIPSYEIESLPKQAIYARYADDWVIALTATKGNAELLKTQIRDYLKNELSLTLSEEKTSITHIQDGVNFLGYHIIMTKDHNVKFQQETNYDKGKKQFVRTLRRTTSRKIHIYPDSDRLKKKLILGGYCTGKEFFPIGLLPWCQFDEYEIVLKYRRIMVGLANYYRNCDNVYVLNRVSYILQYSCAKTIAARQKISMSQVFGKYGKFLQIHRTFYTNNNAAEHTTSFPTLAKLRKEGRLTYNDNISTDYDPFKTIQHWRTKFKIYNDCCICGSTDRVALHHINSLRSIKPPKRDKFQYIRSAINRIQIPVCHTCHMDITHGRYNDKAPIAFYDEYLAKL